ncbi:hypothetical protein FB446DRAFT_795338 [Lentinula raphanica]|nr:hypothetical protein FB446DRAFT_795338 [Lentinula raphanica]
MNGLQEAVKAEATSSFRPKHSSSSTSNRKQTNARINEDYCNFCKLALASLEVIQDTEFGYATFSDGEDQTICNSDLIKADHKDFIDLVYTLFPKAVKYIKASRPIPNLRFHPGIDKDFKKTLSPISPLPDVRSLSSDDEELNAGLELLKTKAKAKGKRRAHRVQSPLLMLGTDPSLPNLGNSGERHSPTPSPPPPPRRSTRRSLFILDSDSEHDEKKSLRELDLEDTFPSLERAIANSRTDKGAVQSVDTDASSSLSISSIAGPLSLNAATVPNGLSNTNILSASPWLVDKRPQWLKDSAGYIQGCNILSTLDCPRDFKF